MVELYVDDVLAGLSDDTTLQNLDDAHEELDRRKTVWRVLLNSVDAVGVASTRRRVQQQLGENADLRARVTALFDAEVQEYADTLAEAVARRLGVPGSRVRVHAGASGLSASKGQMGRIASLEPQIQWAVANAVAETPTPAQLPGTLLERAQLRTAPSMQRIDVRQRTESHRVGYRSVCVRAIN